MWGQGWLPSHLFMLFSCCYCTLPLPPQLQTQLQVWPLVSATAGTQQTGSVTHFFILCRGTQPAPCKKSPLGTCTFKPLGVVLPWAPGSRAGRGGSSWGSLPPCQHPGHPARQGELTFPRLCRQGQAAAGTPHRSPHPERAAGTWTREGPCTAMRKTGPAVGLRGRKGGSRDEAR